jgi:hypothetical protein
LFNFSNILSVAEIALHTNQGHTVRYEASF